MASKLPDIKALLEAGIGLNGMPTRISDNKLKGEMKKFLVSTANVYGYDSDDNLLFTGTTLMDSSIETTLSNTDVRAGQGNQLQYIYYHTAEMNITINEAQFSLNYLALNVGSDITTGADVWTTETVTVENGAGNVAGTPLAISGTTLYGWVTDKDGNIEKEWRKVKVKGHVDEVIEYLSAI